MVKSINNKTNVEKFYSIGARRIEFANDEQIHFSGGFISFGYWENNEKDYVKAAEKLLDFFTSKIKISKPGKILNVACGYGEETFRIYNKLKPAEMIGIDITAPHVEYANYVADKLNLKDKIKFIYGDAVKLENFPDNSFTNVIGIEGPAHFNTREKFFKAAYRVLDKNGELFLTDVILGDKYSRFNPLALFLTTIAIFVWHMPPPNKVKKEKVIKHLKKAGFEILSIELIGNKVFPGYSGSFAPDVIEQNHKIKRMGFIYASGFKLIGKLLGFLHKKGFIDYIFIHARKKYEN